MALWSLVVTDADDKVFNFCPDGAESSMPVEAGQSLHEDVELGSTIPEVGDTYDGATYTAQTPPDYFVVKDGATVLADGEMYQITGTVGKTFTVQKKNGADDADKVGLDEAIKIIPLSVLPLDKMGVTLDTTDGAEDFTVGTWAAGEAGCIEFILRDEAGVLAQRTFILEVV